MVFSLPRRTKKNSRQSSSRCKALPFNFRPRVEELGDRTLPSASGLAALAGNISHDLTDVTNLVSAVQTNLGSTVSSAVSADLSTINTDLGKVASDITTGVSASADIANLVNAEAMLTTDLGINVTKTVSNDINQINSDLNTINKDLTKVDKTLNGDIRKIQNDAAALVQSLGPNVSPIVAADLNSINSAFQAVVGDLRTGASSVVDLNNLTNAESMLAADLGLTHISGTVKHELKSLESATQGVTKDLASVENVAITNLANVKNQVSNLVSSLASNVNPMIVSDVSALNTALGALTSSVLSGSPINTALNTLTGAQTTLASDLASLGPITSALQGQLNSVATSLMTLAIEAAGQMITI